MNRLYKSKKIIYKPKIFNEVPKKLNLLLNDICYHLIKEILIINISGFGKVIKTFTCFCDNFYDHQETIFLFFREVIL
ncbi:hypothetical protein HMPREF3183_00525 [Peptostreptococcus anaerobius]|nr:hypothetical protein HMPREF3183_00525 [Peptostreptococcus anaerobius]